jgi:putative glutamine amidotransferase
VAAERTRETDAPAVRPLIAVTTSEVRRSETVSPTPEGEPASHEMALGLRYLKALEAAGAIPLVTPPLGPELALALLERIDGICLSGGPDLDPSAYGADPNPATGPVESELDDFELALTRGADALGLPILAICRGMQLLNVARGGSLHQHLPELVSGEIDHRQTAPGAQATHVVQLHDDSHVAQVLRIDRAEVNSFHHQAVDRLGSGLVVAGRAPDGTVEALEATDRDFVLGVQWHAESLTARPEQAALFQAFVDAARRRRDGVSRLRVA